MSNSSQQPLARKASKGCEEPSHQRSNQFWDFWGPIFFTFALYFGIRHYIAEARYIPSGSMLPGLQIQDRLIIEKMTYLRRSPKRGEIVVFNSPYAFDSVLGESTSKSPTRCFFVNLPIVSLIPGLSSQACDAYIKRVVAVPGDNVFVNSQGKVFLNGLKVEESYVLPQNFCPLDKFGIGTCRSVDLLVPNKHVLVLGDNRRNSWDSRFWPGGSLLPEQEIIGRAIWRFWPFKRIGILN